MDRREKQSLKTYEIFYQREKHSKGLDCTIQNWVKVNRREESDFKKPKTMPVVEAPITTPLAEQGSFIMMERKGSFTFLSDFGDESPGGSFTFLSDWSGDVSPEPVQYELDVNLLLNQLQESCDPPSPPTTEAIIPESTMEEVGTPVEVSRKESKKFTDFLKNNKVAPYLDIDAWMRYLRSGGPGSDPMSLKIVRVVGVLVFASLSSYIVWRASLNWFKTCKTNDFNVGMVYYVGCTYL